MKLKVLAWSPSRTEKYYECARRVLHEDLEKRCPVCFKGKIKGGFNGEPVVCDTCSKPQPTREPLDRGTRLDAALTAHVAGATPDDVGRRDGPGENAIDQIAVAEAHAVTLEEATRHPKIAALVKKFRKSKGVYTQLRIAIDKNWKPLHEDPDRNIWPRGVWGRVVLDVLHLIPKLARIVDWKSGNIDKKTGEIREKAGYHHSMRAYQAATLSVYPQAAASAEMAFLDAPPKLEDPFKVMPVLKRKDLRDAQRAWEQHIEPMMNDEVFAPRPGYYCSWCPWQKAKGGPCPF